ncbi:MAG: hypothetical protein U0361_24070 [Nitrospiraceae bacterium]
MGLARLSLMVALAGGLSAAVGTGDPAHANDLTIGAAWSMKPAFQEILPMFEKEYGATVKVVYGPLRCYGGRSNRGRRSMCFSRPDWKMFDSFSARA